MSQKQDHIQGADNAAVESAVAPSKKGHYLSIAVTVAVAALVLFKVDIGELFNALSRVGPIVGLLLAIVYAVGQVISAMKWRILLQFGGIERRLSEVVRAYFAGMFINSFGLGTVGGDLARALALAPARGQRTTTLASVAADRVHGLTVLLAIGVIGAWGSQDFIGQHETIVFGSLIVGVVILAWVYGPKLILRFCVGEGRIAKTLRMLAKAFPSRIDLLCKTTLLASLVHLLQIGIHIVIARAIGITIPIPYFFAIIPVVNIISCMPISVQGIGVREGLYLLLLGSLGVQSELAVALGVTWVLIITAVSLAGGVFLSSPLSSWSLSQFYRSIQHRPVQ